MNQIRKAFYLGTQQIPERTLFQIEVNFASIEAYKIQQIILKLE
jgi:hypothetical protein